MVRKDIIICSVRIHMFSVFTDAPYKLLMWALIVINYSSIISMTFISNLFKHNYFCHFFTFKWNEYIMFIQLSRICHAWVKLIEYAKCILYVNYNCVMQLRLYYVHYWHSARCRIIVDMPYTQCTHYNYLYINSNSNYCYSLTPLCPALSMLCDWMMGRWEFVLPERALVNVNRD